MLVTMADVMNAEEVPDGGWGIGGQVLTLAVL